MFFAITLKGDSLDQFHHKVRRTLIGLSSIQNLRNILMIHHRQRLTLGLKTIDDLLRVFAGSNKLKRYLAFDGFSLLGDIDSAHTSFGNLADNFVRANEILGLLC